MKSCAAGRLICLTGLGGVDDVAVEVVDQLKCAARGRGAVVAGDDLQRRDRAGRIGPRRQVVIRAAVGEHVARVRAAREAVTCVGRLDVGSLRKPCRRIPRWECGAGGKRACARARLPGGGHAVTGSDRRLAAAVGGADRAQQEPGRAEPGAGDQRPDAVLGHRRTGRAAAGDERGRSVDAGERNARERLSDVVRPFGGYPGRVGVRSGEHEVVDPQGVAELARGVGVAARHELVLQRCGVDDQVARARGAGLGLRDRVAGAGADVLEGELRDRPS